MKGVLLPGNRQVLVRDFPDPAPGVGEVLVRVKASAICRSDLSLYYGDSVVEGGRAGKVITGHEPAGLVEAVGPGVAGVKPGDRVAAYLAIGCGRCGWCRQGNYHLCPSWECLGFTVDGGNAELMKLPERNCLAIPETMSYAAAAVSTDAFGSLYSAMKKLGVAGGTTVAVFGLGPMGASGIMAAKARGARAIGVDPLASRRDFARSVGADIVLGEEAADVVPAILRATGGEGVDAAVDCSGNNAAQNAALDATRRLGRVAFIGEAKQVTIRPSEQLIRKQLTLMGSWYFNIADYPEIARVIVEAAVPLDRLVTHKFSLDQAEEAFRRFDARETEKAVFVM
jgi:propanol-preferring alcohol dehydrogenase